MKVQGVFLVVVIFFYIALVKGQLREGCETRCGDVKIEYPFGISEGCYYGGNANFKLTCVQNKLLLDNSLEVINISYSSELRVMMPRSYTCYDSLGKITDESDSSKRFIIPGNLTLSERNMLTAVGCNTFAFLMDLGTRRRPSVGCTSLCDDTPKENKGCDGVGCCQNPVPAGSNNFMTSSYHFNYPTEKPTYVSRCIYAFLVENGTFEFDAARDFKNLRDVTTAFRVVLDWSVGECNRGGRRVCGGNSTCSNSTSGIGFICKCREGFYGNPYLSNGCQDIDECSIPTKHNCPPHSTCLNTVGYFRCMRNDKPEYFQWTQIFLSTTLGFLVLLLFISCIQKKRKNRKEIKLRQQFFEQNGGGMLRERLSSVGSSNVDVQIFTEEGMNIATDGYDENRILGQGGQGTVYKGILPDNSIVAIKKARLGDSSQVEQFVNEVLVLSQINHRNVVKLLGCCLETEVPLLVYEFINSGTLFDHLHGSMFDSSPLTWEHRLRIAIEVAGTLAYLHSSASIPIIHRDVKTANILLDENLTAKVADFGASRLVPMDKEELATMVQGTLGYLDPEYYNTGLLNEKSDVYSFGIVLMELLTGQKALCFDRPQNSKHVVSYFASAMKENRLHEVIDVHAKYEENQKEIQEAGRIAIECTRVTGEERPKMKEVATALEGLRATKTKHKWSSSSDQFLEPEDTKHLLDVDYLSAQGETSSIGYDTIKNVAIVDIESGR